MGKINLDPTEEYLDARYLTALVGRWFDSLDVTVITLHGYRSKVGYFTEWWDTLGPSVEWRLTRQLLRDFEIHLRSIISKRFKGPLAYATRHATIREVRMMFKWASETERTIKNYGEWLPWPAGGPPLRRSATLAHLGNLMLAAGESRMAGRDQALLAFFIGTGCRRGEAASMRVEGLELQADGSGTAMVDGKHTSANETGQRAVGFDAAVGKYLVQYMDESVVVSGPLWINDDGSPMNGDGIYQVVRRTAKRAGLEEHIHGCHDLRRAFATILSLMYPNSPAWSDMIRRQLGHKNYSITANHYTLLDVDDIRDNLVTPITLINNARKT